METKKPRLPCLPLEIIESVMECNTISYVDVCRMARTSRIWYKAAENNRVWRKKYAQMWPDLASLFDVHKSDWKRECIKRHQFKRSFARQLMEFTTPFYFKDVMCENWEDYHFEPVPSDKVESGDKYIEDVIEQISDVYNSDPLGSHMMLDELRQIVKANDKYCNLTLQYYAEKILLQVQHMNLEKEWNSFWSQQPSYNSILIEGLCLISRWFQITETVSVSEVLCLISSLSERVYQEIEKTSPNHPLIEKGMLPPGEVIEKSLWTQLECKTILDCISFIIFEEMEFSAYSEYDYLHEIFIDKIMAQKRGPSDILCIVYAVVAGRLGVNLSPINTNKGYVLLEQPCRDSDESYIFVAVHEKGIVHSFDRSQVDFLEIYPIDFLFRIYSCIFNEMGDEKLSYGHFDWKLALDLCRILNPPDAWELPDSMRYFTRVHLMPHDFDIQRRSQEDDVKYAVGMIMECKDDLKEDYIRCVIYEWQIQKRKATSRKKRVRYLVLGDEERHPLVYEENLKYLEPDRLKEPISNNELGKYFESFHGAYYLPNETTRKRFPHDEEFREQALRLRDANA